VNQVCKERKILCGNGVKRLSFSRHAHPPEMMATAAGDYLSPSD
jgi:hypothetical protein